MSGWRLIGSPENTDGTSGNPVPEWRGRSQPHGLVDRRWLDAATRLLSVESAPEIDLSRFRCQSRVCIIVLRCSGVIPQMDRRVSAPRAPRLCGGERAPATEPNAVRRARARDYEIVDRERIGVTERTQCEILRSPRADPRHRRPPSHEFLERAVGAEIDSPIDDRPRYRSDGMCS